MKMIFLQICILFIGLATVRSDEDCFDIGCFPVEGDFATNSQRIGVDPQNPREIDATYLLYTRENRFKPQRMKFEDLPAIEEIFTSYKPEQETKIVVHGFMDDPQLTNLFNASWMHEMKNEMLKADDYNVILVSWARGNKPPYFQATANTRVMGAEIAEVIKKLVSLYPDETSYERFHVIGHSLGSHIAGYAGDRLDGELGRITGLDPAGPYFQHLAPYVRLDPSDAKFVDAIHTDGTRAFGTPGFGMMQQSGHVDFYPNDGYLQPGCSDDTMFDSGFIEGVSNVVACSHLRAYSLYIESINPTTCKFIARPCDDSSFQYGHCPSCPPEGCDVMGFHAKESPFPKLYLNTAPTAPYCRYYYGFTLVMREHDGMTDNRGEVKVIFTGSEGNSRLINLDPSEPTYYTPGQVKQMTLDTEIDIGELVGLELTWEHMPGPLANIFGTESGLLEISYIDVRYVLDSTRVDVRLCSDTEVLESGGVAIFTPFACV